MPTKKTDTPTKAKKVTAKVAEPAAAVEPVVEATTLETDIDAADTAVLETGDITKAASAAPLKRGKNALVKKLQSHDKDSGSTEVQVALLTSRINDLVKHLKLHAKDHDSRQGLLKMVGRRRRLLRFLKQGSEQKYQDLIVELKLRK